MDKTAVLIPCFNEKNTIGKVVDDWKKALPGAIVYVYDNNSTDGSGVIAAGHGAVVRHEYQQGKGNVIRRMFREINAECYILVDADDTYPAEQGAAMAELILSRQADMVIGDRLSSTYFAENKRRFHGFGNRLVRDTINRLFHCDIRDIMTGLRAFSFLFVKSFPVLSKGFEIETEMTIHAVDKNLPVKNVIVDYRDRPDGSSSKLNTYSDGAHVIGMIGKLYRIYRPLKFFGWISLILLVISFFMFMPILLTYLSTGLVPKFPTLIVCGFIVLTAIISAFSGLILSSMTEKEHQDFEFRLQLVDRIYKRLHGAGNERDR